jgi:hypothetical protein
MKNERGYMSKRRPLPKSVEKGVLLASRRRCCLCVFLDHRDEVRRGQIAHLNHDPNNSRFENLVWLCLEHHDEYDGRTSQSKGITIEEVREYRDRLYARNNPEANRELLNDIISAELAELPPLPPTAEYERLRKEFPKDLGFISSPWRYPLWQVANKPDYFAYKAGNRSDGVCLIERIDLPDERIVIACIETAGNSGNSITNCVEELCFQVCERFEIPADRLMWLEHYDYDEDQEWRMVTFSQMPPQRPFENPKWITMTPELWKALRLRPKKRLIQRYGHFESKLTKLFHWPTQAL